MRTCDQAAEVHPETVHADTHMALPVRWRVRPLVAAAIASTGVSQVHFASNASGAGRVAAGATTYSLVLDVVASIPDDSHVDLTFRCEASKAPLEATLTVHESDGDFRAGTVKRASRSEVVWIPPTGQRVRLRLRGTCILRDREPEAEVYWKLAADGFQVSSCSPATCAGAKAALSIAATPGGG